MSSGNISPYLVEGVEGLYKWSLINIISAAIIIVSVLVGAATLTPFNIWNVVTIVFVGLIVAAALGLIAIYFLFVGFRSLSTFNKDRYGIGYTGVKLLVISLILAIIGLIVIAATIASLPRHIPPSPMGWERMVISPAAEVVAGGALILISLIALFIGVILVAIALWRLGDEVKDGTLIKVGAVLMVVAIILMLFRVGGILDLIATILIFLGAEKALKSLRASATAPSGSTEEAGVAPPPPPT